MTNFRKEVADKFSKHLKSLGYRVFRPVGGSDTYGYYSDGEYVAYFQSGDFGESVSISTSHVPNRLCGTGFRIVNEKPIESISESEIIFALRSTAPGWAVGKEFFGVKKNTLEKWLKKNENGWSEYV